MKLNKREKKYLDYVNEDEKFGEAVAIIQKIEMNNINIRDDDTLVMKDGQLLAIISKKDFDEMLKDHYLEKLNEFYKVQFPNSKISFVGKENFS